MSREEKRVDSGAVSHIDIPEDATLEDVCALGEPYAENHWSMAWVSGTAAAFVEKKYGETSDALDKVARSFGYTNTNSIRNNRRLVDVYPKGMRYFDIPVGVYRLCITGEDATSQGLIRWVKGAGETDRDKISDVAGTVRAAVKQGYSGEALYDVLNGAISGEVKKHDIVPQLSELRAVTTRYPTNTNGMEIEQVEQMVGSMTGNLLEQIVEIVAQYGDVNVLFKLEASYTLTPEQLKAAQERLKASSEDKRSTHATSQLL